MDIRDQVAEAFREEERFGYSHVQPFQYTNFIDGMAWVSMLMGASVIKGDDELITLTQGYVGTLLSVGNNARNFAPANKAPSGWYYSPIYPMYSFKRKAQSFAGPSALAWAVKMGARVDLRRLVDVSKQSKWLCRISLPFGYAIRYIPSLRQHINSVMFAHLMLGKIPSKSMLFLAKDNPVYSYIFGIKCSATYPITGPWPAKDYPGSDKPVNNKYVPLCSLVGEYLQSSL